MEAPAPHAAIPWVPLARLVRRGMEDGPAAGCRRQARGLLRRHRASALALRAQAPLTPTLYVWTAPAGAFSSSCRPRPGRPCCAGRFPRDAPRAPSLRSSIMRIAPGFAWAAWSRMRSAQEKGCWDLTPTPCAV